FTGALDGDDGVGYDDLLVAVGSEQLATDMRRELDESIASLDAVTGTFSQTLASDEEVLVASHSAIKDVTDLLKSQFVSVLALEVPQEGAADND
ncbi:MAG: peptidase M75, partial [Myxococcota bacterium]